MFTKRVNGASRETRKHSMSPRNSMTSTTTSVSTKPVQHYNDWPNAVGFDTAYEEHEPVELSVKGHIPAYAAGTLFRTAIGPRSIANGDGKEMFKSNHWFDGFSQVHRFQLHPPSPSADSNAGIEKVTYNSRLTCDKLIASIAKTGKLDQVTFAAKYEPCKSFFHKMQSVFTKDAELAPNEMLNAVTMTVNYPGLSSTGSTQQSPHDKSKTATLCNKTDSARLQFLDPDTLEPIGKSEQSNLDPRLKGVLSAAHPEVDPVTGDTFNYNLDFTAPKATYRVFRTSAATGKTSILATISHFPAYLHSLFLTEHYVVLCVWNSHFSKAGASILWQRNLLDSMYFNTSPAIWFVIDRRCPATEGGKGVVARFESDPFFAFHTVNAYEGPSTSTSASGNQSAGVVDIICDVSAYSNMDVIHAFYMDQLMSSHPKAHEQGSKIAQGRYHDDMSAHLRRYRLPNVKLDLSSTTATTTTTTTTTTTVSGSTTSKAVLEFTVPAPDSMELPTFNPSRATKPYRYVYGIMGPDGSKSTFVNGLVKYDLHTRRSIKWQVHGHTPGEAIFIARPGRQNEDGDGDEDDGVLLSVVLDGYTARSYLLCLDARDLSELGRVEVGGAVGFGFHGAYTAAAAANL